MSGNLEGNTQRPRAVSDYLMERFALAGAQRVCIVISPDKADILEYYGGSAWSASICYTVQPRAEGLCDAIFRALLVISPDEPVLVGLPDTVWFPADALKHLPDDRLSFLLFPVSHPQLFDSVECDPDGRVLSIRVKEAGVTCKWIWGAFKMPGTTFRSLYELWNQRDRKDEYVGTLINAWIEQGGEAWGVRAGDSYFDVGSMDGYLEAMGILMDKTRLKVIAERVA